MAEKTSAALGLFDGIHLGHRRVLELALKNAEKGLVPAVFTFEPDTVLKSLQAAAVISILPQKKCEF